ncbi:UDP-glycosyltransferase 75C1-like [Solanum pennellii]|uniref:Glycosyltransferase n=1 Tax=Solanum pennellii TaxID=28526 RepID=A0ABM1FRV8_SOLPN|nr:UDP-glycosyltransferase 75C1-like [Solanum pennellii]
MNKQHFLVISLPAQGHINPTLQLAKNLARAGARATFITTVYGLNRMNNLPTQDGLFYSSFSDGCDDDSWMNSNNTVDYFMNDLKINGSKNLKDLVRKFSDEGHPVTFLVYTILLPWVAVVAREIHVPSAFLVIQCGTAFAIYYHLLNSTNGVYSNSASDFTVMPSFPIEIPELPLFSCNDIPTIVLPNNHLSSIMIPILREHIQNLENDPNSYVLINTFNALEEKSMRVIDKFRMFSIGPLVPLAFSDGNDPKDKSFGCELFDKPEKNYHQWLDSRPEGSVVYVSFGSLAVLKKEQEREILRGLLESERPFLWTRRKGEDEGKKKNLECDDVIIDEKLGLIVPWCSQMEVLCHKSIGCFVTHCGWNSTLESLVSGVPIVGYPQFSDQTTNAKMLEEVWGIGVRVKEVEGLVKKEELKRCLGILMENGEKGEEIKRNVKKWRNLALDALKIGGSSHDNLKKFIEGL